MQRQQIIRKTIIWELAALALVVLSLGLPRGAELARYVTPDEYLWLTKTANFYEAISNRDFASTFQIGHPGVTIMWAGMAGLWMKYQEYIDLNPGQINPDEFHAIMQRNQVPVSLLALLRQDRIVMVLANVAILALGYLYARRLLGTLPALLGFLLIAFDPFHLGLTRLLHLDGMMGNFALLSLLAFLVYLVNRRLVNLLVSGVAAGLGLLTKSPAMFMIPVIGVLAVVELWLAARKEGLSRKLVWSYAWPVLAWFGTGVLTVFACWPAMWVQPIQTLTQVVATALGYAESGHSSALFFNGQVIPDGKMDLSFFYFYPLTYLWRATPVVLAGLVLAVWSAATRREPFDQREARLAAFGLLLLSAAFIAGMTLGEKKFDRYILPVYPAMDIIAGLGWYSLFAFLVQWSRGKKPARAWRTLPVVVLVAAIGFQAASALITYPYYLSYYNPLMGGSRKAPQVMQIGWGEGIDQAARYLNQKPNAAKLKVISWYDSGSFSYFFKGADRTFWSTQETDPDDWQKFITSDYAVVYIAQWQRQIPKAVLDYVAMLEPEHSIWINGLEYARIYAIRQKE